MRYELCLAGSGGQGLVLAGIILAEAAGIYDKLNVVQHQSYGPEARGGASRSDVIISDTTIFYPQIRAADVLLALTQEAYEKYLPEVKPNGLVIVDSFYVKPRQDNRTQSLPLSETAKQVIGREIFTNILSLGVIVELTKVVSISAITQAVAKRAPKGTIELNLKALEAGFLLAKNKAN